MGGAVVYGLDASTRNIERTVRLADEVREQHTRARTQGSQLDEEVAVSTGRMAQHLQDAVTVAAARLAMVEEHLATMVTIARKPHAVYSLYTTARTTAEVAARAWWLLDTSVAADDRAQRGLAERKHSLEQQFGFGSELRDEAKRRRSELMESAGQAGLQIRTGNRRPESDAELVAYATDPEDLETGKMTYRLLSAYTHGTVFALSSVLQLLGEPDEEGVVTAQVQTAVWNEASVFLMGFLPYLSAVSAQLDLYGWPASEFRRQALYTSAGLRELMQPQGG